MSVYKPAKSPFWHYDFQLQGRRFHGSTGVTTERRAREIERRKRQEAAEGKLGTHAELTLDQACGLWWAEVGQYLKSAVDSERRVQTLVRLMGPSMRLVDIRTRHVSVAIQKRRGETYTKSTADGAKRYPVSNATVNRDVVDTLRRVWSRAEAVWEVPGLSKINWKELRLEEPPELIQFYTAAQRRAWLAECSDEARDALQMLLTYGLRLNELFFPPEAFADDEDEGPRLVLNKRKKDVHLLPLRPDDAKKIRRRVSQAKAAGLPHIWFRRLPKGKLEALTYYGLQAQFNSAASRAGIKGPRRIHGARHSAGTQLLAETGNLKLTQKLLGHKSINSTMRYAHAMTADLRAALEGQSRNSPEPQTADTSKPKPHKAKG